jgi:hypothetical protein
LNPSQRATSLAETLDALFLEGATLNDLYQREKAGKSPHLILNSTLYNNGRRVVMTTLPSEMFTYNLITQLKERSNSELPHSIEDLAPFTFAEMGIDPTRIPLSQVVTASASFPPIIGPITVQVEGADPYWHIGDGGLFENRGVTSLTQLFLKKISDAQAAGTPKRALILVLDSSFPFWVGEESLDHQPKGFEVFINDPGRIVGIQERRADAYQSLLWNVLQAELKLPREINDIKVIVIKHTEADIHPNELPGVCMPKPFSDHTVSKEAIAQYIARIPTLFKIKSNCDSQLLELAAAKVVEQQKGEILAFLKNGLDRSIGNTKSPE